MTVATRRLPVDEEALRRDQVQAVLCPRHRDIEQPALLLDLIALADRKVARDAAIDGIKHEHLRPFLALGRMDRRQDQIILVEMRRTGLVAGGVRRIKCQIGEKTLARRIAGRDLLELQEVSAAGGRVLVQALEMLARTTAAPVQDRQASSIWPAIRRRARQSPASPHRPAPARGRNWSPRDGSSARCIASMALAAADGPMPGMSCITRKAATRSFGVFGKPQQGQDILHMGRIQELQPTGTSRRECCGG